MKEALRSLGLDLGRSTIGAINLGLPLLYTMETWWLAWRLPAWLLTAFALLGLAVILAATHLVGFEHDRRTKQKGWKDLARDFIELVVTSFLAAYIVLLLFGIIEWGDSFSDIVRLGLIQVVPLGLGASIANAVFSAVDKNQEEKPPGFAKEMATFALGAAFFAFPVAPTEEMELMAAHAGWWRLVAVALATIVFTYLILYEIEFRGRRGRLAGMESKWLQVGETLAGYVVALGISALLLFGYGHFTDVPFNEIVQKTVTMSMIAAFGGAAARVVV